MGESTAAPANGQHRLRRWQLITLAALFVGYAGYYLCRSNLSVSAKSISGEFPEIGKTQLGILSSVGLVMYATGKVVNGLLADLLGGRRLFLLGMVLSVACTVTFASADRLSAAVAGTWLDGVFSSVEWPPLLGTLAVIWALNRFVQSMGWGGLVGIVSRWYPAGRYPSVMGVLSMSYLLGDTLARLYLGVVIELGTGWRGVFLVAAATLGLIALAGSFTVFDRPGDKGLPDPNASATGTETPAEQPRPGLRTLLVPLMSNPMFWLVCAMNAGLTFIRETFNFWSPSFLKEAAHMSEGWAAIGSAAFPTAGALAALAAGALSERFGGRHGRVAVPSMLVLIAALLVLGTVPVGGRPLLGVVLIGAVGFGLMAPYTFCSGVMAIDLGGRHGSGTSAGLIDGAGYFGAVLSGYGFGKLAELYGWGTAFTALAGVAGLTSVAAFLYLLRHERTLGGAR
jgi:OPA family glycerol-3-phosphate transporter-like MFS transporter